MGNSGGVKCQHLEDLAKGLREKEYRLSTRFENLLYGPTLDIPDEVKKILQLPNPQKIDYVRTHALFMGFKRWEEGNPDKTAIRDGVAAIDYAEFLKIDTAGLPLEAIYNLNLDNIYHHCTGCGEIFEGSFENGKNLGYISSKEILHPVFQFFNVSEGLCTPRN